MSEFGTASTGSFGATRPRTGPNRGIVRILDQGAWLLCFVAILTALVGYAWASGPVLSAAGALIALSFLAYDLSRVRQGEISPITLFAAGSVVANAANVVGLLAQHSERRPLYFLYAVDEYLFFSAELTLAGTVLPVLGFWMISKGRAWSPVIDMLPRVNAHIDHRALVRWGSVLAILIIAANLFARLPSLGTVTAIVQFLPSMLVFALARVGAQHRIPAGLPVALLIALLEALRALWFSYLRSEIILPLAAFTFGALMGARSFRVLRHPLFVPVYVVGVAFVLYFGAFGSARGGSGGLERIQTMYELEQEGLVETHVSKQTLLSRLTTFNPLSQIGYLVERDGYYGGETLDYLGYAFVPRFLWPEKPLIAKGAWFAIQIGQGYLRRDGSPTNSVAMTIPGELYLNFGWTGVFLGCLVFGMLFAVFWTRTTFWKDSRNTLGSMFGFYLFWTGFGLGADLQLMVTVTATYLLFVAASAVKTLGMSPQQQSHSGRTGAVPIGIRRE